MRKLMNKKGFSLVELMIVVVIMGILIAVAIPLYGAITDNANAKTCANNIKVIKNASANFYASNDQTTITSTSQLADMMEEKVLPKCPLGEGNYKIFISADGSADVQCPNYSNHKKTVDNHSASPEGGELVG